MGKKSKNPSKRTMADRRLRQEHNRAMARVDRYFQSIPRRAPTACRHGADPRSSEASKEERAKALKVFVGRGIQCDGEKGMELDDNLQLFTEEFEHLMDHQLLKLAVMTAVDYMLESGRDDIAWHLFIPLCLWMENNWNHKTLKIESHLHCVRFFIKRIPCRCLHTIKKDLKSKPELAACQKCHKPIEKKYLLMCGGCRTTYCSKECQLDHRLEHKTWCKMIASGDFPVLDTGIKNATAKSDAEI